MNTDSRQRYGTSDYDVHFSGLKLDSTAVNCTEINNNITNKNNINNNNNNNNNDSPNTADGFAFSSSHSSVHPSESASNVVARQHIQQQQAVALVKAQAGIRQQQHQQQPLSHYPLPQQQHLSQQPIKQDAAQFYANSPVSLPVQHFSLQGNSQFASHVQTPAQLPQPLSSGLLQMNHHPMQHSSLLPQSNTQNFLAFQQNPPQPELNPTERWGRFLEEAPREEDDEDSVDDAGHNLPIGSSNYNSDSGYQTSYFMQPNSTGTGAGHFQPHPSPPQDPSFGSVSFYPQGQPIQPTAGRVMPYGYETGGSNSNVRIQPHNVDQRHFSGGDPQNIQLPLPGDSIGSGGGLYSVNVIDLKQQQQHHSHLPQPSHYYQPEQFQPLHSQHQHSQQIHLQQPQQQFYASQPPPHPQQQQPQHSYNDTEYSTTVNMNASHTGGNANAYMAPPPPPQHVQYHTADTIANYHPHNPSSNNNNNHSNNNASTMSTISTNNSSSSVAMTPGPKGLFYCTEPGCTKVFDRQQKLKSHSVSHKADRPFICGYCNLAFQRNHDLTRHMRLHTNEKPHKCMMCTKSFMRADALKRHCKIDHGEV
ncbi:hypothetical protein HK100_005840 [Physocladia obscura]|uniref:C2H2-type domain-containing protein n=1 Tax=Physocladia obscura TaxID=109957 RepID=A0AAD5T5L6_9FUNG|nr:hypothetical protein HK100_005840 [Physocladia obscura]